MAFDQARSKSASLVHAADVLNSVKIAYVKMKDVAAIYDLYIAGTDATFNAAVNAIFNASDLAELAAIATHYRTWCTEIETNHSSIINI